ncbi:hypothetical protein GGR88_000422 [Sphingomonas jejuensis]|uniref:Uncharacterized protein n=1 Tax=Sphingomonas jejuensis TaxID=904715 RepID=A0ABX0XIF8_9SPHN|nr:hypothetical protein [Sphingomonas jejuensis]NJC32948.1 hypothetical protein [Sphingomonas jejuensis]
MTGLAIPTAPLERPNRVTMPTGMPRAALAAAPMIVATMLPGSGLKGIE